MSGPEGWAQIFPVEATTTVLAPLGFSGIILWESAVLSLAPNFDSSHNHTGSAVAPDNLWMRLLFVCSFLR